MIYNLNSIKEYVRLNNTEGVERANTVDIDTLLNSIDSNKTQILSDNEKISELNYKISLVQSIMKDTYKELISTEIKSLNLNIAAESIKERNDYINSIYNTVTQELLSTAKI